MSDPATPQQPLTAGVPHWIRAATPAILYGLRLATAVSLALLVAFYLELDNPSWAGTSAGIVCQPVLGASIRKGVFRMIGTVAGATVAVVLTGIFPQNRLGFLFGMALWAALCAFGGTLARNFAAYAFALSGYTLAIIAGDSIAQPDQVFHLAVTRATEIVIGIACATAVVGLTDLGRSRGTLADAFERLGRETLSHFLELLDRAGGPLPDGPHLRRGLIARAAALDPVIDAAIGEAPELRHRKAILYAAQKGLFSALSGWRTAESHLVSMTYDHARRDARILMRRLPSSWREAARAGAGEVSLGDLGQDRTENRAALRDLASLDTDSVSTRLLADASAGVASGLTATANGLALLRDPAIARDPGRVPRFVVADYLPAVVNALRTFVSIGAAILFWIVTEWPSGLGAITFLSVTVLLLGPQQERSGAASVGFGIGTVLTACLAAVVNFALLPNHETFLSLSLILAAFLVPLAALSTHPLLAPYLVAATMNFVPLVGPSNEITFDAASFFNSALGIVAGCVAGTVALTAIPPIPRRFRATRLVALTVRDLRRIAAGRWSPSRATWETLVSARLGAMPEQGIDPQCGSRLVAALSLGVQAIRLRSLAGQNPLGDRVRASLAKLATRDLDGMLRGLDGVDEALSREEADAAGQLGSGESGHERTLASDRPGMRIRTSIQVIRDVVRQHRHEFEAVPR